MAGQGVQGFIGTLTGFPTATFPRRLLVLCTAGETEAQTI